MLKEFDDLVKLALIHGRTLSTNQEFIAAADALSKMIETIERDLIEVDNALMGVGINRQRTLPDRVRALIARVHDWTPVGRVLPVENSFVLCATVDNNGNVFSYFVGYHANGLWRHLNIGGPPVQVTHWCEFERLADAPCNDDEEITADVLSDLLSLVGVDCPVEAISDWTFEQMEQAREWAAGVHLQASDNDEVEVPLRPKFLAGYGGHLDPATCPKCLRRMEARNAPDRSIWICGDCGRENPV